LPFNGNFSGTALVILQGFNNNSGSVVYERYTLQQFNLGRDGILVFQMSRHRQYQKINVFSDVICPPSTCIYGRLMATTEELGDRDFGVIV
jgi:hypothetical protein